MKKIFISYRWETKEHCARVRQLGEALDKEMDKGEAKVVLDVLADEREFKYAGPPETWTVWSMVNAATSNKVVIVASDGWLKSFLREEKSEEGKGSATEAWVIFNRLKQTYFMSGDIRLAVFGELLPKRFSLFFPDYTHFKLPREWENLLHWLSDDGGSPSPTTVPLHLSGGEDEPRSAFTEGRDNSPQKTETFRSRTDPDLGPTEVERIVPPSVAASSGPLPPAGITIHWKTVTAGPYQRGFTAQEVASLLKQLSDPDIDADSVRSVLEAEPVRQVDVPEFQMARELVTNEQFRQFVDATGYRTTAERSVEPKTWRNYATSENANHPVVQVSFEDAQAFCHWAGVRLPTLDEWIKAYRGPNGNIYPWGSRFDPSKCNTAENKTVLNTSPVGMFADYSSHYGCCDMIGNVHEWVDASGDAGPHVENINPAVIEHLKRTRAVMGGAWSVPCQAFGLPVMNMLAPIEKSDNDLGFRVAK